jgi:cell division protein FtsB
MRNNKNKELKYFFWFVVVALLLGLAVILLFPSYRDYRKRNAELNDLKKEEAYLNDVLREKKAEINSLENSPGAIEEVAREKYHLVGANETVLTYPEPQSAGLKNR